MINDTHDASIRELNLMSSKSMVKLNSKHMLLFDIIELSLNDLIMPKHPSSIKQKTYMNCKVNFNWDRFPHKY